MSECCFFCEEDGDFTKAVAKYVAEDDKSYAICPKHLKLVKQLNKEYWIIDEEFEDSEVIE